MNQFQVGKHKVIWVGDNFKEWFSGVKVSVPKKVKLEHKILERPMTDEEILKEWNPQVITLGEVLWAMKNSKDVLTNGYVNIFYVKDKDDTLRAVDVGWYGVGWRVDACSVSVPRRWFHGDRVFSRKFLESVKPSDTLPSGSLTLENRVKALEEKLEKISKILS